MTHNIRNFVKQYTNYKQTNGITSTQRKNNSTKIDWRTRIVEYLNYETTKGRDLFKQENGTWFIKERELRKEIDYGESKICIAGDSIKHLIKRVHEQNDCHLNPNDTIQ
jgi:hypothetical protein